MKYYHILVFFALTTNTVFSQTLIGFRLHNTRKENEPLPVEGSPSLIKFNLYQVTSPPREVRQNIQIELSTNSSHWELRNCLKINYEFFYHQRWGPPEVHVVADQNEGAVSELPIDWNAVDLNYWSGFRKMSVVVVSQDRATYKRIHPENLFIPGYVCKLATH